MQKILQYVSVKGEGNLADGLTKHVRKELSEMYSRTVNMRLSSERAKAGLQLANHD